MLVYYQSELIVFKIFSGLDSKAVKTVGIIRNIAIEEYAF